MLFNSIDFAIFLIVVFVIYWFIANRSLKLQNALIVGASYIFYGWWDWRFLSLIIFSTTVDYLVGRKIHFESKEVNRKILLVISIFTNIGLLGFFKYYDFFLDSFTKGFLFFGAEIKANSLNIILPVGISFYTFQTLSYTIDIYKRKLAPADDFVTFCAFVCFFPQLVAGPIERATNLLPQFSKKRTFDALKASDGMRQILWGFFKKVVIADNCAELANQIFNNSAELNGSTLVLGALFFTFQIYGDFSGYSDIAIGVSRLFGFNLMQNFAFPYFSRDVAEFWRRWHISLSTWFRDYLYIPLGGSRGTTITKVRNTFIIFIVSGLWHGANWTFVVWGALNAVYFLPLLLTKRNRNNIEVIAKGRFLPTMKELFMVITTFILTMLAWIFFRAENIEHAISYISGILSPSLFTPFYFHGMQGGLTIMILVIIFVFVEWIGRNGQYALHHLFTNLSRPVRYVIYYAIVAAIICFGGREQQFIYFQF